MNDVNNEDDLDMRYNSEVSAHYKVKKEGKLRSKVWEHFTKIIQEDGKCDRCQCNHCHKLFSSSSRSGTGHLLRHIADGICPSLRNDKEKMGSSYPRVGDVVNNNRNVFVPVKFNQGLGQCSNARSMDVEVDPLSEEDDFGGPVHHSPLPTRIKIPQQSGHTPVLSHVKMPRQAASKSQPKGEVWMTEFKNCVAKLVELANGRIPVGSIQALAAVTEPDYSISAALKCLNEMDDIEKSSDMYLDAFEILQDAGERECFICLPPEPRRRWLQRVLHRQHPLRYSSNL